MSIKCAFCSKAIRKGTRPAWFRYDSGAKEPMHRKCYDFMHGRIDGTAWDIGTPGAKTWRG